MSDVPPRHRGPVRAEGEVTTWHAGAHPALSYSARSNRHEIGGSPGGMPPTRPLLPRVFISM